MEDPRLWLRTICLNNRLPVEEANLDLLLRYVQLLLDWNTKINLISRRDVENVWKSHILHSLAPLFELNLVTKASILDLGTGGGLPGIPLKIFASEVEITLLDSTKKKIMALQDMIEKLNLQGVNAVWGRAEEMQSSGRYRAKFDYVLARAVAPLDDLARWSSGFLRSEAKNRSFKESAKRKIEPPALIALKGGDLERETERAKRVTGVKSISIINPTFLGSEQLLESDKKIIVVHF